MVDKAMTQARAVILYTRPDCHLCEFAARFLEQCAANWVYVDIEIDLDLIRRYGQSIPVLYRPDIKRELFWPFTVSAVRDFISDENQNLSE